MADKNMNAKISVDFEESASRQSLNSGDSLPTLFGKTKKFFSDLKTVAFSGSYNDLTDLPESSTPVLNTTQGNPITITDGVDAPLIEFGVYGKSVQDGTPTPETPVDIVSVGDDGNVGVTACGKNLLLQTCKSETINGVTFTVQSDGSIIMNGTATGDVLYNIYFYTLSDIPLMLSNEKYILSFGKEFENLAKNNPKLVAMVLGINVDSVFSYPVYNYEGKAAVFDGSTLNNHNIAVRARLYSGAVCNNVTIYPQIELGSTATVYEPYTASTATITSGLPLCSVGDVRDELIYNADGTGKVIKRIYHSIFDGSETWSQQAIDASNNYRHSLSLAERNNVIYNNNNSHTMQSLMLSDRYPATSYSAASSGTEQGIAARHKGGGIITIYDEAFATATIDEWKAHLAQNPLTVIYVLNTPQEIELSAAEMAELMQLQTFDGVTNIVNDESAEMSVKYWCDNSINALVSNKAPLIHTHVVADIVDFPDSLPANGGNADTVNGLTVQTAVPADAKFTDTVYTLPTATIDNLGGVKIDDSSIQIDEDGTISINSDTMNTIANAITSTTSGLKVLKGTTSASTVTFSEPFSATPTVVCTVKYSSTTVAFLASCHITEVSTSKFTVYTKKVTANSPDLLDATVHWVAFGT